MRFLKKYYPYALYITLGIILLGYIVNFISSNSQKHINYVSSETNALVYDINSKLYALPSPNLIKPQATSGVLAGQLSAYEEFSKDLDELKFTNVSLAELIFANKKASQTKDIQEKTLELSKQLKKEVDEYRFALMASKKLIEYNPNADLKDFKLGSPDSNERLDKTIAGIKSTSDDLYKQNGVLSKKINNYTGELTKPFEQLKSSGDVRKWNIEVLKVQDSILNEFGPVRDNLIKAYSKKLFDIINQK